MPFTYDYPRPALTVDAIILSKGRDRVLLVRRGKPPFRGQWALPGGFVGIDETLEDAIVRELREETGIEGIDLKQFRAFGAIGRDPRHRTVSIVFHGLATPGKVNIKAGDDAEKVSWFSLHALPELAFDHREILEMAVRELK